MMTCISCIVSHVNKYLRPSILVVRQSTIVFEQQNLIILQTVNVVWFEELTQSYW